MKVDKSDFMELVSDITTMVVIQRFGEDTFEEVKIFEWHYETQFTEDAQDFFNEQYDVIETMIANKLKINLDLLASV
tara:strand:+ start:1413 stop:1643 length:231 start_codon:yes stop_codon:yes gene_type:complete